MHKKVWFGPFVWVLLTANAIAASKFSIEMSLEKMNYLRPAQGVGKAGTLVFKSASMVNDDLVLNLVNVNNIFDSQIFVRPTFLGATTQFGNFGSTVKENNLLNSILKADLEDANAVFDANQLNFSGKFLSFEKKGTIARMSTFRLYCQNGAVITSENDTPDPVKSCLNFLTLNGNYGNSEFADVEFSMLTGENLETGIQDKMDAQVKIKSFDIRRDQIILDIPVLKSTSNDSYKIEASGLKMNCAKDEDLESVDIEKIKKACSNRLSVGPLKASLNDPKEKTRFGLDLKSVVIKDKLFSAALNGVTVSDPSTTTYITSVLLNCKKDPESDLFLLTDVLRDCFSYSKISIGEVRSLDLADNDKDSSNKNIAISINNGVMLTQAEVKFLGLKSLVKVYGKIAQNESRKQIIVTVTDTRLPLGINSVKLLMYFLKKNLVSKDIAINGNVITVSL
jgi:hypothetical protein